jgi:hypothetical protein
MYCSGKSATHNRIPTILIYKWQKIISRVYNREGRESI